MDSFSLLLQEVMQKPNLDGLKMVCSNLEAWDIYKPSKVKEKVQKALTSFLSEGSLVDEEDMLRLYKIMAKHSRKMGAKKVFERVEEQGRFKSSLKFHLMWAESCAQGSDLNGFINVFSLAKSRLPDVPTVDLEAGFRDIADQYFPNSEVFNDDEETMAVFNTNKAGDSKLKRNRRRSSLANLEFRAKEVLKPTDGICSANFGANTRTKLRYVLVDRPEDFYVAPSIEELRVAMVADQQMLDNMFDVPMDITTMQPESIVNIQPNSQLSKDTKELAKRNRVLETVEECDSECSNDDKRRRVLSPALPIRCGVSAVCSQKLQPEVMTSSSAHTAATFITGSSFTEKAYNEMKAMFSDTVDINQGGLRGITDETTRPVSPPVVEAFEVFVDEELTQRDSEPRNSENISSQHCATSHGERIPFQTIPVYNMADSKRLPDPNVQENCQKSGFDDVRKTSRPLLIEDEETMSGAKFSAIGIDKKPDRGIVTSTPAHQLLHPPTHEDFFAPLNKQLEEQLCKEEDEEQLYAQSAFMRRRSLASSKSTTLVKPAPPKVRPVQAAERSMEIALNKMNLGESECPTEMDEADCGDYDKTGIEHALQPVTDRINPWDRQLRMKILSRTQKPCYQHDFDIACPCVSVGKMANIGGESFDIVALIGQGGFAKVYKTTNEEGKTLALKYEAPSCPWEVHICNELRIRLNRATKFVLDSLMQVTEAYVFINASLIFSEYHPYGTLLDVSNKLKEPSWYIILLIAIQMAKIFRDVHGVKIIHGDVKPDNFMILNKLNDGSDLRMILSTPFLRLIDWGRAIDMHVLQGHTFTGKVGTENFNCSEMLDGRPWTYQTDYFGFVGTMHVVIFNKYAEVVNKNGVFEIQNSFKRRLTVRPLLERIFHDFLNIPDCNHFPDWDIIIQEMEAFFYEGFSAPEWRQAVARFNSCL